MQKKIKYYETVSAANISLYANLLANVLFQFRGGLPKIEDDYKYFTDGFKTLTISQETGELDFENSYLLHNPKLFSQELPKNKQEALKICRKFFIDRTEKLQANEKLRQLGLHKPKF
ncbi:MAG: hypothetical protein B6I24_08905 [Bacteroidetes bacterium 4572_128]|nr:MAG: hypothetical protein B6I24_08905 [Bacteroidetes bacterium 4572_128]